MAKYREIVYDIMKDLRQTYDDKTITPYQVLWWVAAIGNDLLKRHQDNENARTGWMSGQYLTIFPKVKILTVPATTQFVPMTRKHFELPQAVLDFDYDTGIDYISYSLDETDGSSPAFTQTLFERTTLGRSRRLYVSFEHPSPDNPYFYVVGNKVYLLGLEDTNVKEVEVGLRTAIDPSVVQSLDEDFIFPEHLIKQLKYEIANLGSFILSVPEDKVNDGNNQVAVRAPKQVTQNEQ